MLKRFFKRAAPEAAAPLFGHDQAQRHELESNKQTIRDAYPALLGQWRDARATGHLWQRADDQWFLGNSGLFDKFVAHVRTRKCLEIGSGPFGYLAPCWWIKDRVVIDPLIDAYRAYEIELCGESWFDGVRTLNVSAEEAVPDLVGAVDGLIVSRNCLDHCEDPLAVLNSISEYATPGCWLLLWTDIWHLHGPSEGHRNITRSTSAMDKLLRGMGFEVIQAGQLIRSASDFIEFGRLAIKT